LLCILALRRTHDDLDVPFGSSRGRQNVVQITTIDERDIQARVMRRVGRVLTFAEALLPREQFEVFRRYVLREFGDRELRQELKEIFGSDRR
jgi:hypothetical protein